MTDRHFPPCNCFLCVPFLATCECHGREYKSYVTYQRHLKSQRVKLKRGPRDPSRTAVVPDGLGYLTEVLANKASIQKYNLSVISRFCAALNEQRPTRSGRFTRSHKNLLSELAEDEEKKARYTFTVRLTHQQADASLRLAQSLNLAPPSVLAALLAYGLEYLARELRENASAPPVGDPNIKKTLRTERQTAAEEFLGTEPKQHEYKEYAKPTPTPVARQKTNFFPRSN